MPKYRSASFNFPPELFERIHDERIKRYIEDGKPCTITTVVVTAVAEYLDRQDRQRQLLGE